MPLRNSRRSLLRLGAAVAGGAMLGTGRACRGRDIAAGRAGMVANDRRRRRRPALRQAVRVREGRHSPRRALAHREPESSVSFTPLQSLNGIITPNGLFFERYPRRPRRRRSAPAPALDPRLGRAPARADDGRHHALSVGVAHPFHRMSGQRRHGMARGAAQFAAIHPRHDRLRRMDRREALDLARRSRAEEGSQVGDGRRRRRRAHEPQPAARQVPRRLSRRLWPERRGAAARTGLSAAHPGARLGGQCQRQMAAPHQGRRRAVVLARGDLEIHRTDAGRKSARLHLGQRGEVGHHLPLPGEAGGRAGPVRNPRPRLERPRQDQAGRRLVRRRRELAAPRNCRSRSCRRR